MTFVEGNCPSIPRGALKMTCGVLHTLENRNRPGGRIIQIQAAVVHSSNPSPAPDPLVYLPGGPGSSGFEQALGGLSYFSDILKERDIVIIDPRGTGYSKPKLDCPEFDRAFFDTVDDLPFLETQARLNQVLLTCQARLLQEGIEISQYNNQTNAADLENLRLALGYKQWNLLGVSYGARAALTLLREYPQGVRSAILDSVIPPQVEPFAEWVFSLERSFDSLFANCAADESCRQTYPNLEADFYRLVEQLDAQPIRVRSYAYSGSGYDVGVDGDALIQLIFMMFYYTNEIARIPKMIENTLAGDTVELGRAFLNYLATPYFFEAGVHYAVFCSNEAPFVDYAQVKRQTAAAQARLAQVSLENSRLILELCKSWEHDQPPASENLPVRSSIPALILAGEYDPITPPEWGELTAATLENAHFYLFRGLTHGVFYNNKESGGCVSRLITAFLRNPSAALEDGCVAESPMLKFEP